MRNTVDPASCYRDDEAGGYNGMKPNGLGVGTLGWGFEAQRQTLLYWFL